ncbi:MAG: hypothetical protein HY898_05840 [Deltaproteobacteria bacterium]|nr:hypothetical protein [Deltaproteobacteria bacterium]
MTYRIENSPETQTVVFEGQLDALALDALRAVLKGRRPRLVLQPGTRIDSSCVQAVRALGVPLIAESPFLAHLLAATEDDR